MIDIKKVKKKDIMGIINFYTPIDYAISNSLGEKVFSITSNYFNLGLGVKRIKVVEPGKVQLEPDKIAWYSAALKVASYVLLCPVTLILLAVHAVLKNRYKFTAISEEISDSNKSVAVQTAKKPTAVTQQPVRCVDKLGENETWIPAQLLEKANNKKVYLFEVVYKEVKYLFFSKNKHFHNGDFSPNLRTILEKNSLIKQRIAMCYYASAYLHLEVQNSFVISMGDNPWYNETSLITQGMSHHQLLYKGSDEFIIIDPTWPRFELYQSVVLLASTQEDCDQMYEIAFGRDYRMSRPVSQEKEHLCSSLNISMAPLF